MLNIQRSSNGNVVFSLSGRIEVEDVSELQRLLELETVAKDISFDLREVTLIEREAVKFLAQCEMDHISLENCPAYIRESIDAEKARGKQNRSSQ
jgi:hypothetical protein